MQTGFIRRFCPAGLSILPLLLVTLLTGQAASAQPTGPQQTESVSSSVVLVLKLVSAQRVRPVTGIVVSADGLVLVPADFVATAAGSPPAEIVVLDGGTDILSHGRPATVVVRSIPGDLALLSVEGLNRPGITLSETDLPGGGDYHLEAFPPAQHIAKGAQPLWMPLELVGEEPSAAVSVSAETPLPYVTGAIMDACGYLAGLSMASGEQSLESDQQTVVIFNANLGRALDSIQINLPGASCVTPVFNDQEKADTGVIADLAGNVIEQEETALATELPPTELEQPMTTESSVEMPQGQSLDPVKTAPPRTYEPPSLWRSVPWWLFLAGFIVIAVLVWKVIALLFLGKGRATPGSSWPQPASDEPDTIQLQAGSDTPIPGPRSGHDHEADVPDMNNLPDGCNGLVMIEGQLDAHTGFRRFCTVDLDQVDIVIGRGAADIRIEHPAISRSHARLEHRDSLMTLSDLGSSNGTYIKGVPCLPGEVMFIEPDDEVFLGDVRFHITLVTSGEDLS
jgi:hypothetical protein